MEPEINGEGYTDVPAERIIAQDDILVAPELAQWLRIGLSTTYEWAKTGKIPCIKLNGLLRFLRKDIEAWLTAQRVTPSLEIQSLSASQATIPSVSTNLLQRTARHVLRDRVHTAKRDPKRTPRWEGNRSDAMGVYRRSDSPTWWMSLQVAQRRVRLNTGVEDRRLAEEIFAAWKVEVARERWLGARPPDQHYTVKDLIDKYLALVTPRKAPDSQRRDRSVLESFRMRWGSLRLCDLSTDMIEEYLTTRLTHVTYGTASKELGILKAAYHAARRWGWVIASPFVGIKLNQAGGNRIRWLTYEEERILLSQCSPWLRDLVIVGLDTGLRPGNLVQLQRSWVHRDQNVVIVPQACTKTRRAPITVPLTSRARAIILRWMDASPRQEGLVSRDGHSLACGRVNNALRRLTRAIGLEDVCLYTLRHTFVTRLVQAGRSLPDIAALAGHRSVVTTMRYVHVAPHYLRESIRALESSLRTGPAMKSTTTSPTL